MDVRVRNEANGGEHHNSKLSEKKCLARNPEYDPDIMVIR